MHFSFFVSYIFTKKSALFLFGFGQDLKKKNFIYKRSISFEYIYRVKDLDKIDKITGIKANFS